ncbi:heterokaryon incompatibility protein-domain-containing protein [Lasiosphaeria hispida]|uniref:Heterokaryon incompatibility protein-domain-containing protein n=1 Tax=Lasiosphaeria hispida TaxID=260671 RepID=A0AAJ0HAL3_9PEZI|nr:heterokaryon incompatibility protein-domain-containing protein [Lasiosphaeria hispida]
MADGTQLTLPKAPQSSTASPLTRTATITENMASAQLPDYVYTPLGEKEIRILDLHPGKPGDELMISISSALLTEGQHVAVSYVWGSEERPHVVKVADAIIVRKDGKESIKCAEEATSILRVTENLKNLLVNIRDEEFYMSLWIDAIAINQKDEQEKTAQVKMMGSIYVSAPQTILYIGESDENSKTAFRAIEILNMMKDWPDEKIPVCLRDVGNITGPDDLPNHRWPPVKVDPWPPFIEGLFDRPWFNRTWVVQEVILSKKPLLVCGSELRLPWGHLVTACQVVRRSKIHELDPRKPKVQLVLWMEKLRSFWVESWKLTLEGDQAAFDSHMSSKEHISERHILSVIRHTRNYQATDPRDKVFGLIGFTVLGPKLGLNVDYGMSLTELYTRVAKAFPIASRSDPLIFLSMVDQSYYTEDLPSWVADWRRPWKVAALGLRSFRGASRWDNLKRTRIVFPDLTPPVTLPLLLTLTGCRAVTIKAVERAKSADWRTLSHSTHMNAFPEPYPTTHMAYDDAFVKAVHPQVPADFQLDKHPRQQTFWKYRAGFPHAVRDRPTYRSDVRRMVAAREVNLVTVWDPETEQYLSLVKNAGAARSADEPVYTQDFLYQRKLPINFGLPNVMPDQDDLVLRRNWFISEDGFMGLVPELARAGDVIVHLFGGRPLYVLRQKEEGGRWGFLGEAYVFGLMDGEVEFDMPESAVEEFVIE